MRPKTIVNPLRSGFRKHVLSLAEQSWRQNDSNVLSCLLPAKEIRLLDAGCGAGDQTARWNNKVGTSDLVGIEISRVAAREAKQRGMQIVICDLNRPLPFVDSAFDVIISNQVIEHLLNIDLSLSEMNRVLKESGYAVISTENLSSWHNIAALLFGLRPFSLHYSTVSDIGNPFSPHESESMRTVAHKDSPHVKVFTYYALKSIFQLHEFYIDTIKSAGNYIVPLGRLGRVLSRIDPVHSHLLTFRLRKTAFLNQTSES
jgi:ubiquinone/menaquinone biosynthesis C-methylase UbiE